MLIWSRSLSTHQVEQSQDYSINKGKKRGNQRKEGRGEGDHNHGGKYGMCDLAIVLDLEYFHPNSDP